MLTIKTNCLLCKLRKEWEYLQNESIISSPYQNYSFLKTVIRYFYPYYFIKKSLPLFYSFYNEEGICVAIIPVLKRIFKNQVTLLLDAEGFAYCDILSLNPEYAKEAISMLLDKYDKFVFNKVLAQSKTMEAIRGCCDNGLYCVTNCVCIDYGNDYDAYLKSLSKSTRQNLRTAYNRLEKGEHKMEFVVTRGGSRGIKMRNIKKIIDVYSKRHLSRYGLNNDWLKKWFLLHQSFVTKAALLHKKSINFTLKIDGNIASFMTGIEGDRKEFVVPRLTMSDDFAFFSPGMLLVNEVIKWFIANSDIRHLDLSKGEEEYKYKMGGLVHNLYGFTLTSDLISFDDV